MLSARDAEKVAATTGASNVNTAQKTAIPEVATRVDAAAGAITKTITGTTNVLASDGVELATSIAEAGAVAAIMTAKLAGRTVVLAGKVAVPIVDGAFSLVGALLTGTKK